MKLLLNLVTGLLFEHLFNFHIKILSDKRTVRHGKSCANTQIANYGEKYTKLLKDYSLKSLPIFAAITPFYNTLMIKEHLAKGYTLIDSSTGEGCTIVIKNTEVVLRLKK